MDCSLLFEFQEKEHLILEKERKCRVYNIKKLEELGKQRNYT